MAFVKSRIGGREIKIATAFYRRRPCADARASPACWPASSTILSRTSSPPPMPRSAPDYSRLSPFASILKDDNRQGRFVPPAPVDDPNHAWVATALPASVFKPSEQRCLAAAVYFEARGEPVKGQAAVAQVVLNRVRNPAYPATGLRRRLPERGLAQPLPVLLRLRRRARAHHRPASTGRSPNRSPWPSPPAGSG